MKLSLEIDLSLRDSYIFSNFMMKSLMNYSILLLEMGVKINAAFLFSKVFSLLLYRSFGSRFFDPSSENSTVFFL